MRKNFTFILLIVVLIALTAMPAIAAKREATPEQTEALFAKQSPLTQSDIDIFIEHAPALLAAMTNDEIKAAAKTAGLSSIRSVYVTEKIKIGYGMLSRPDLGALLLENNATLKAFVPTEQEMKLIKRNQTALKRVL